MVRLTLTAYAVPATVDGQAWTCADPVLRAYLQALPKAGGASPDPDLELAERALAVLGGTITAHVPAPADEDTIY